MKKKIIFWLMTLLLILQIAAPPVQADKSVYFLAAGDSVLPLEDASMPFWKNGYLYVPIEEFTGSTREALNISYAKDTIDEMAVLYRDSQVLVVKKDLDYCADDQGHIYRPGGLWRNGHTFVPAAFLAQYFSLDYSVSSVDHGYLVWLRPKGHILSEKIFVDAATGAMNLRYREYEKQHIQKKAPEEVPETQVPVGIELHGDRIYICMEGNRRSGELMDILKRKRVQAAFFCTPDMLADQGGLLRRMMAEGHTVGILADGRNPNETVEEQLHRGNMNLMAATCGTTRMVMIQNGNENDREAAMTAGYSCFVPDVDRSGYHLQSSSNADGLVKRLERAGKNITVWLADTVSPSGLESFLQEIQDLRGLCVALSETA